MSEALAVAGSCAAAEGARRAGDGGIAMVPAVPWELRLGVCDRALQDLDCAPDSALPHILDAALAAAPYDETLRAVIAAAAAVGAADTRTAGEAGPPEAMLATATASTVAPSAAEALSYLRLLQRLQGAVLSALRGLRRVPPEVAVRVPALVLHPALLRMGHAADAALAAAPPTPAARTTNPSGTTAPAAPAAAMELLAAARALGTATCGSVLPALLCGGAGGSRVSLAAAAALCRRVLGPHPELCGPGAPLGAPLVHLLCFSVWAERVDGKGLLSRKYEPDQALPARAAICAWLEGLHGTCESLGCEALVLPSRAVTASEAFKRQAVSSERWLPLQEVGPRDLPAYLAEMRAAGYSLVAVEQAAGSVPLQAFAWPPRCVLLLGNEQSGVPQGLIAQMDACVEIPMLGVTRSLNAHVSGAMAVWQYVQQQQGRLGQQA